MEEKKKREILERKRIFIEKSRQAHQENGNPKYDYSKVEYTNNNVKVIINCPKEGHGDFEQLPKNHLTQGCPKCGLEKKSEKLRNTKDEFIRKSILKHHDEEGNALYDYSLVEYVNSETKVKIICKKEGHVFEQEPGNHQAGSSCNICSKNKRLTNEEFIKKCQETRVDENNEPLYDYDLVKYVNNNTNVKIKCKNNHVFEQNPFGHLKNGRNCLQCIGHFNITFLNQFIEESNKIHNNKYDYSKTNFTRMNELLTITCPEHGDFLRTAFTHLIYRRGCPKC